MIVSLENPLAFCFRKAGELGRRLMELGDTARLPKISGKDTAAVSEKSAANSDQLVLSDAMQMLRTAGIDLNRSGVIQTADQINFNLQFEDEQVRTLTSNGFYDARSQSLKMDLSFRSAVSVVDPESGEKSDQLFEFNFRLELSNTSVQATGSPDDKEDILQFARKLLDKISKLSAEGKPIDGLDLKEDDLKDVGAVDNGRLLRGVLHLIQLITATDQPGSKSSPYTPVRQDRDKARSSDNDGAASAQAMYSLSVAQVSQKLVYQQITGPIAQD